MSAIILFTLGFFVRGLMPTGVSLAQAEIKQTLKKTKRAQKKSLKHQDAPVETQVAKVDTSEDSPVEGFSSLEAELEADDSCERFKEMRRQDPVLRFSRQEIEKAIDEQRTNFDQRVSDFFVAEFDSSSNIREKFEQLNEKKSKEISNYYKSLSEKTKLENGTSLLYLGFEDHRREFEIYQHHHDEMVKLLGKSGYQKMKDIVDSHNLHQLERARAGLTPGDTIEF